MNGMNTNRTNALKEGDNPLTSRRTVLKLMGAAGAATAIPSFGWAQANTLKDEDIFNFALNLESLETEYYLRGTTGKGMEDEDIGPKPGRVRGGRMVPWKNDDLRSFMEEVALNELAHVRFYRKALGSKAVSRPEMDIAGGFAAAAKAAGLGDGFDPFASEMNFFLGGMLMEDVGVTAYNGAVPLIKNKTYQQAASGILAVESYHMGMARSSLYRMGTEARQAANAISDARDKLDGRRDVDQGIEVDGKANIVPSDSNGIAFTRTPQQVLNIVYLNPARGVSSGGIFPNGLNGTIKTT
jgi:hypothetical protein